MSVKLKAIVEQVIVITGASSGIGLASALAAARQGAKLALIARGEDGLASAKRACESLGAEAMTIAVDVANNEELEKAAQSVVSRFGRIDTWVNDAGIGVWGKLIDVSEADSRRLFDTNFWGVHNGSRIAVKYLRDNGGALINLGSVASDVAFPLQSMYAATKSAIQTFTNGLRIELRQDKAPISVTLIKPAAIGTPFGNNAKNYLKQEPQLPPPLYRPEEVAAAIIYAAAHPITEIAVGGGGSRLMTAFYTIAPRFMDFLTGSLLSKAEFKDEPARPRADNLYNARGAGETMGTELAQKPMRSFYTRLKVNPALTGSAAALVATAAAVLLFRRSKPTLFDKRYWTELQKQTVQQTRQTANDAKKVLKRAA
jgi:short-subunit dehydrogenase